MTKKKQQEDTDIGNPRAAKIIKQVAQSIAEKQGKSAPDDSDEFYEEFNERIKPWWKSSKKST